MKRARLWVLLSLGLMITGCATIPPVIRYPPAEDLQLAEVRENVDAYTGKPVRWGGSIVSVNNEKDGAWIEVVDHELNRYGVSQDLDRSSGRFLVRTAEFLDPAIYAPRRLITVAGTLAGSKQGTIGDYAYRFPVVKPITLYLWPREDVNASRYPRYHVGVYYGHGHFYRRGFYSPFDRWPY